MNESRFKRDCYFNLSPNQKKLTEYLGEYCNWQHLLWCVLMFQAWLAEQGQSPSISSPLSGLAAQQDCAA